MKIAYDSQIFSNQVYGGVSRYFYYLIKQILKTNQHKVKVFAPLFINKYVTALPNGIVSGRFRGPYPARTSPIFRYYNIFTARSQIKQWKPDILHETYFSPIRTGPKETPSILTVYDMVYELFNKQLPYRDWASAHKKRAIDRASHIICISESTRQDLLNILGIPREKVSVIHLGYEKYESENIDRPSPILLSNSKPYVLYVGQRLYYKNFNRFLKAFSTSPQICKQFDIVCFGGGQFTNSERNLIDQLGMKEHVKQFSGNDALLGQFYNSASAFVYPSLYEGFGLPLLEAMAHGCPVACSHTSSLPEVVGDAAELFDPFDVDSICNTMEKILFSAERHKELVKMGFLRLTHFSWKKCMEQTLQIYKQFE